MLDDDLLVKMYVKNDVPCDQLVSDPDAMVEFTNEYERQSGNTATAKEIGKRLLNLRRRGQNKGGLPRIRRRYNGRGNWRE